MAIEHDVLGKVTPRVGSLDPKASKEKSEDDPEYWQKKERDAKARAGYLEAERTINAIQTGGESPFKLEGRINLGEINPQKDAKEAQERAEKEQEKREARVEAERKRADEAEAKLREEQLNSLRRDFSTELGNLSKTIEKLTESQNQAETKDVLAQFRNHYEAAVELAKSFGYERTSEGTDPHIQLEIKKMEMANAVQDREFKWRMRQDEKNWELERQKLNDDRLFKQAQLNNEKQRNDMLASFPQLIGGAFARGIMDQGEPQSGQPQTSRKAYIIEMPEGEHGTVNCPNCQTAMGIGPDQTAVQCIKCRTQYPIRRQPRVPAESQPAEEIIPEEEQ